MTDLEEPGRGRAADEREALDRRLDLLERENARLKGRLADIGLEDNPNFNAGAFQKALQYYTRYLVLPVVLVMPLAFAAQRGWLPRLRAAVTNPMPVIPVDRPADGFGDRADS